MVGPIAQRTAAMTRPVDHLSVLQSVNQSVTQALAHTQTHRHTHTHTNNTPVLAQDGVLLPRVVVDPWSRQGEVVVERVGWWRWWVGN